MGTGAISGYNSLYFPTSMNIFSKKDQNKEVFLKLLSFADNSYAGNITQILKKAMSELGITSKFMIEAERFNVLTDAVNILLADRRVQWEVVEKEIKSVCALLGFESIPDAIVESVDMIRLAFLSNAGHPEPLPPPSSLLMKRGESLLFSTPGNILEERVIDRRYEGGSRGISIRIMKGVKWRKLPTDGVQTCKVSKTNGQGEQVYSAEGMDEIRADSPQFF